VVAPYYLNFNFWLLSSFDDPGPHGLGRYMDSMMPEVRKSAWRKGAQVHFASCIIFHVGDTWYWTDVNSWALHRLLNVIIDQASWAAVHILNPEALISYLTRDMKAKEVTGSNVWYNPFCTYLKRVKVLLADFMWMWCCFRDAKFLRMEDACVLCGAVVCSQSPTCTLSCGWQSLLQKIQFILQGNEATDSLQFLRVFT
jgi:hypothetical protein